MSKMLVKYLTVLLIAVLVVSFTNVSVYATEPGAPVQLGEEEETETGEENKITEDKTKIYTYENYKNKPNTITTGAKDTTGTAGVAQTIIGSIITIAQVVGMGVAVIMLIVLAIKYISAAPGDKADIKKHAVVYVVGAVVLFAASGILQIIKNFAKMVNE